MEVFLTLVAIILSLTYLYLRYQLTYWKRRGIPHDEPEFFYGNIKNWRRTKHFTDLIDPVYFKHKGKGLFAGFYLLFKPVALATDVEFVKHVLIKDFNNFVDRGAFHNERDDPLTAHLFTLDGEKWRKLRQKLSQTFTSGKMKFMFPTVLKIGEEFSTVMAQKVAEADKGTLEMTNLLGRFTADVIGSCAFGIECNSLKNPEAEFVTIGRNAIVQRRHNKFIDGLIEAFPDLARLLHMRQLPQYIHDFYMGIVKDTVKYREEHKIQRNDFMNMLIDLKNSSENKLTLNEIAGQAFVFFLAGFETSSTTMSFVLYELSKNQNIQQKLRDHINEVYKKHQNEFTYECIQDMKYLDQVLSETLRKYPILPNLVRRSKSYYATSDPKYYIDKNTLVIIPVKAIHYDPSYYPEPDRFDPDRFTEEQIKSRPACTFLPFGDGPRNCIGLRFGKMQAAIGLAFLIKNFKFDVCEKTPKEMVMDVSNVLLSSLEGMHLKVQKV